MSLNLEIINPITFPGWDELLSQTKNYSFFHTAAWAKVLHETYGYKPLYFSQIENGKLEVTIPIMEINSFLTGKRGVSLPFSDYCEPIVENGVEDKDVFKHLVEYGTSAGWKYLDMKGWNQFFNNVKYSSFFYRHILPLMKSKDEIYSSFRDSTKRNIKKALKNGVIIKIERSIKAVDNFYQLNCHTRKIHGLPPQPKRFFDNIYKFIISQNKGFVITAFYNNIPIAGAVYFHFNKKALYKFGASVQRYFHLRANNLVIWTAIKYFLENNFNSLCFGKTEPGNKGLLQFKHGWGATEKCVNNYKYDFINKMILSKSSSHVKGVHNIVFKNIPITVSRLTGNLLYRHIG